MTVAVASRIKLPDWMQDSRLASKARAVAAFAEKARRHLLDFCSFTFSEYDRSPHVAYMAQKLEAVERGEIKRLMIFMPPRHGKTEMVSVRFPAWILGKNPDRRIIHASYGSSLSNECSRKVRNLVEEPKFRAVFHGVGTQDDRRSVESWGLRNRQGGMFSTGVGGAATGYGADFLIIDDPVKNAEEAESELQREKVWEWYRSVARTRLEKNASIIIILTRWHQDDLAGRLLAEAKKEGEAWEVINLPAVWNPEELKEPGVKNQPEPVCPLNRKVGEALWPWKYNLDSLRETRNAVGSRTWFALYQGVPRDPKARLFKRDWFQYYDSLPPKIQAIGGGMDTATSKKSKADNTSIVEVVRGRVENEIYYYVDKVFLDKVTVSAGSQHVLNRHAARKFSRFHLEKNNAGEAYHQRIVECSREKDLECPPIECVQTSTDKVVRALEFQPLIENGTLKFRRNDPAVQDLVDHLCDFDGSGGTVDDDIDGLGFAVKAAKGDGESYIGTLDYDVYPERR